MKGYIKMNQLTMCKRKIMQFSLSPESQEILRLFNKKYGTNKSLIIDRALTLLAAQYHTTISIKYEITENMNPLKEKQPSKWEQDIERTMEIAKASWIDD